MSVKENISASDSFDRGQAFLVFSTMCGDVERTAACLNVRAVDILRAAEEENWLEKLKPIIELSKSDKKGSVEKAINRALNFAQCHRMRLFIERIINRVSAFSDEDLDDYIFHKNTAKDGSQIKSLTTRAVADLSAALEKIQALTYLALNDGTQARLKREEKDDDGASVGDLSVQIAKAMASVRASSTPRAQLLDAQLEVGQSLAKEATRPVNPNDSDEH